MTDQPTPETTRCDYPEVEHPGFPCAHPPRNPALEEPRPILCSECGFRGEYEVDSFDPLSDTATVISTTAHCWLCGHEVNMARDIEPNLEPGERLVIVNGYLAAAIAEEVSE